MWAAVAAGVAGVAGAAISSNSAKKAAQTQANATAQASDATLQASREAQAAQQPFLDAGYAGANKLVQLLGLGKDQGTGGFGSLNSPFSFTAENMRNDPVYQFQLQQGQEGIDRKSAAGGGFYSQAGLRGAAEFNQGLAGTAYDRAQNTYQLNRANTINPLQALAGQGQTSANANSAISMNTGNSMSNLITSNANAQGASQIAQGNALAGGLNNGLAAWQRANYLNQPQQYGGYTGGFGTGYGFGNQDLGGYF